MENKTTSQRRPSKKNLIKTSFMEGTDPTIAKDIEATLNEIPFTKFSIPLYAYIHSINSNEPKSDKVIQVGFIKSYDKESKIFHIMTYMHFKDAVRNAIKNPEILVDYGTYEGKFTKINRLIIVKAAK